MLNSLSAKRYERLMKAHGINQTPPSIRDAPTASRPRKKKVSPEPSLAPASKKRKLAKSEDVHNKSFKEEHEDSDTKVEKSLGVKGDPKLSSAVMEGHNSYPWYNDTAFQQDYESQAGNDDASFKEYIDGGDFGNQNSNHQKIQSSAANYPYTSNTDEGSCVNSYDANLAEALTTKYPYIKIKDESAYVSPYAADVAETTETKLPYLNVKSENSYVNPYDMMNINAIKPAPFSLDHCTNNFTKFESFSGDKEFQYKNAGIINEAGSILIAD